MLENFFRSIFFDFLFLNQNTVKIMVYSKKMNWNIIGEGFFPILIDTEVRRFGYRTQLETAVVPTVNDDF